MQSGALLFILAVFFPAANTLPLYSDRVLTTQEDILEKLVKDVENRQNDELNVQRDDKTIYPLLVHHERDRDSWPIGENLNNLGAKETLEHEKMNNMVDELKTMVLKLAGSDNLRSQGYMRSEQNLPKPKKRACFWKYCVTN